MIGTLEGDAIEGRAREIICDFAPEFPGEHAVHGVMGGVGEFGYRGHSLELSAGAGWKEDCRL